MFSKPKKAVRVLRYAAERKFKAINLNSFFLKF